MKKFTLLCFCVFAALILVCCKGEKTDNDAILAPEGMNVLELSKYGKPFAIFVPDTTRAKLEIIQQSYGALDIKVGKNFAISINEQAADIDLHKSDITGDEVNKLKSFIVDEANAILWESEITQPEFHFILNKKIGTNDYSFEEIKNSDTETFGKEAIQKMFDNCKNIQEIKKETKS
jgi:hypothetical protein